MTISRTESVAALPLNTILSGDCIEQMNSLPEASVDRSEPRRFGVSVVSAAAASTDAVSAKDVDAGSGAAAGAAAAAVTSGV